MGKVKSKRSSLKMGQVIRKKAKAKRDRVKKLSKTKQFPKRSAKKLIAPQSMPNREQIQAEVHQGSDFINKVIKPIQSSPPVGSKDSYTDKLEDLRKEILEQHRVKVEQAKIAYQAILDAIEESEVILEVLDARDPTSCRFLEAEGEVLKANKKLIFVINRIDTVPRECVTRWASYLEQTAPVVAVSATDESALPAVQECIARTAPNATKISVMGLPKVGKTTICNMNTQLFREIPSISFAEPSEEMALLDAAVWVQPIHQLALYTVARVQDESLFEVYGIPPQETPDAVIEELAKKWDVKPKEASRRLVSEMTSNKVRWFAVPNDAEWKVQSQQQEEALKLSIPLDMQIHPYVHIAAGEAIRVDEALLTYSFEEEEEEDGEEEEEEKPQQ